MKKNNGNIIYFFIFLISSFFVVGVVFNFGPKAISNFFSYFAIFSTKLKFNAITPCLNCFKELKTDSVKDCFYKKENSFDEKFIGLNKDNLVNFYENKDNMLYINGLFIKNKTNLNDNIILSITKNNLNFKLEKSEKPQILIYHTHSTESYSKPKDEDFNLNYKANTSVVEVGEEMANILNDCGLETIHDATNYDVPSYIGSYFRSGLAIKKNLKKYPTIKIMLDIHLDCKKNYGEEKNKNFLQYENDKKERDVSKIMFVLGCGSEDFININFEKNFNFACALQRQLERYMPGVTKPIEVKNRNYNQNFGPLSILVKVGNHEDYIYKAKAAGYILADMLNKLFLE